MGRNYIEEISNSLFKDMELKELAEQLCQNKNGRKIAITDVAISKVPYVAYPDLTISESLLIHELGEHLLSVAKNENDSNEISITCDLQNVPAINDTENDFRDYIALCKGTENETTIFADTETNSMIYRAKDVTVINLHNHPSCNTFSVDDISIFLKFQSIKMMVVLSNKGEVYYISKENGKYNHDKAVKDLFELYKTISPQAVKNTQIDFSLIPVKELREIADTFLKNCRQYGIKYEHILGETKHLQKILKAHKEENSIDCNKEGEYDYDEI